MDFVKICRSCLLQKGNMKNVFEYNEDINTEYKLNEIITGIAKIEMYIGDGMPDKICDACIIKLINAYEFICKIQQSDRALHDYQEEETYEIETLDDTFVNDESVESYTNSPQIKIETVQIINNDQFKIEVEEKPINESKLKEFETEIDSDSNEMEHTIIVKFEDDDGREKKYMCDVCEESFTSKVAYSSHKQCHKKNQAHVCEECGKTFATLVTFQIHQSSKHNKDTDDLTFNCADCDRKYPRKHLLEKHMQVHLKPEKSFSCTKCEKSFFKLESLSRHMKTTHAKIKPKHICDVCNKEFPYLSSLNEHMKNHTKEKPFLCSLCGKGFRQKGTLRYHYLNHTGGKPHKCSDCSMTFASRSVLRVHMRRHTDERPYICDICGRGFHQISDLRGHHRVHSGERPVECIVCQKRLSTTGQLTIHMRAHTGEKPFLCPECNKPFATKSLVAKHLRTHTGEKPYRCDICDKSFTQSGTLTIHKRVHQKSNMNQSKVKRRNRGVDISVIQCRNIELETEDLIKNIE